VSDTSRHYLCCAQRALHIGDTKSGRTLAKCLRLRYIAMPTDTKDTDLGGTHRQMFKTTFPDGRVVVFLIIFQQHLKINKYHPKHKRLLVNDEDLRSSASEVWPIAALLCDCVFSRTTYGGIGSVPRHYASPSWHFVCTGRWRW
jgi:hypothetical protein